MRILTVRPKELPYKNGVYFPNGIPGEDDNSPTSEMVKYLDEKGKDYWICYTSKQVANQVKEKGFFAPFIPLHITDYL